MPYDLYTPFGVRPGQVTDEERMNAATEEENLRRQGAQSELAARLGIAGMNNQTQRYGIDKGLEASGTFGQRSAQEATMFDRGANLSRDLDKSATDRAFGTIDRQMGPAMGRERRDQTLFDEESPLRKARSGMQQGAMEHLRQALSGAGGQATAPSGDQLDLLSLEAAIANGGAIPDVSGRSQQRQVGDLQITELKRQQAIQTVQQMIDSGDIDGATKFAQANNVSVPKRDYNAVQKAVLPEIDRVQKFIRSNNWSIAGNKPELDRLFQQTMARIQAMRPSPEAATLLEQDLKNAMRDALKENGVVFESAGSDAVRDQYGL